MVSKKQGSSFRGLCPNQAVQDGRRIFRGKRPESPRRKKGDDDSATGIFILLKESKEARWQTEIFDLNWLQSKIGIWIVVSYCKFGWLQGFWPSSWSCCCFRLYILFFATWPCFLPPLTRETSICVMISRKRHWSTFWQFLSDSSWRSLILGFDSEEVYGIMRQNSNFSHLLSTIGYTDRWKICIFLR